MTESHVAVRVGGFTSSVAKVIKVKAMHCKNFTALTFAALHAPEESESNFSISKWRPCVQPDLNLVFIFIEVDILTQYAKQYPLLAVLIKMCYLLAST